MYVCVYVYVRTHIHTRTPSLRTHSDEAARSLYRSFGWGFGVLFKCLVGVRRRIGKVSFKEFMGGREVAMKGDDSARSQRKQRTTTPRVQSSRQKVARIVRDTSV